MPLKYRVRFICKNECFLFILAPLFILLSVFFMFRAAFAAEPDTAENAFRNSKVSIAVWDFPRIPHPDNPNDRFKWLTDICCEFEKLHPNVKVDVTKLTWNQGAEKIKIAVFAGAPPDITSSDLPVKYIEEGLIEPVDDALSNADRNDYFGSALDAFTYAGKTYGFPWAQKTDYMYLNKKIFARANVMLPKDGLWSGSEFLDKMKEISKSLNIRPFGFCIEPEQSADLPLIFNINDTASNMLMPVNAYLQAAYLHSLIHKENISAIETGGLKSRDIWVAFKERQNLACAPFGIWALPALAKDKNIDFDIAQFPSWDGGIKGRKFSYSSVIGFFIFKQNDPAKLYYCKKLAAFITDSKNQSIIKYYGQFPTRKSLAGIYSDTPLMKKAFELFEYAAPYISHPAIAKIDESVKAGVQKILLSKDMNLEQIKGQFSEITEKVNAIKSSYDEARKNSGAGFINLDSVKVFCVLIMISALVVAVKMKYFRLLAADIVKNRDAYIFLIPALAVFLIFFIIPVFRGILIAFQDFKFGTGMFERLCGLKNYEFIFTDRVFLKASLNTLIYTVFVVPANIVIALVLASLLYKLSERVQTIFKGAFYLPGVISIVTLCIVWRYIFDFNSGVLNIALNYIFGIKPLQWITSQELSLLSIILFTVLKGPGGALLIYLTALVNIPKDYYEAASIDGAGPIRSFFKITVPLLAPQTMFLVITLTIDAMQVFAPVMLLTEGGPANSSEVVVHRIYKEAFNNFNIGEASAMSVVLFIVILAASVIQYKYFRYDYY